MKRILSLLLFPSHCLYCEVWAEGELMCKECLSLLQPLDPALRCIHCFKEVDHEGKLCSQCQKRPLSSAILSSVFEKEGPARTIASEMEAAFSPPLVKAAAGYLVYQFYQLAWDRPDCITFAPQTLPVRLVKNTYPSFEIAKEAAKLLQIPFEKCLKARQEGVCGVSMDFKKEGSVFGKTILMISLKEDESERKAVEKLFEGFPRKVYHLMLLTN